MYYLGAASLGRAIVQVNHFLIPLLFCFLGPGGGVLATAGCRRCRSQHARVVPSKAPDRELLPHCTPTPHPTNGGQLHPAHEQDVPIDSHSRTHAPSHLAALPCPCCACAVLLPRCVRRNNTGSAAPRHRRAEPEAARRGHRQDLAAEGRKLTTHLKTAPKCPVLPLRSPPPPSPRLHFTSAHACTSACLCHKFFELLVLSCIVKSNSTHSMHKPLRGWRSAAWMSHQPPDLRDEQWDRLYVALTRAYAASGKSVRQRWGARAVCG